MVSLSHKGEEEKVVALQNRRLTGGRVITALHTVRDLNVTRIFEVVLNELNDRQRYSERDAGAVAGVNTQLQRPATPRGTCASCTRTKRHALTPIAPRVGRYRPRV